MKIGDIAMFLPNALASSILKTVRFDIDKTGKEEMIKNGLYHITSNEETVDKIIESGYLKPSTGLMKNFTSYGTAAVFLFNGRPSADEYIKNLTNANTKNNPYLNPTMVVNGIKISPTELSEVENYKVRSLVDNILMYEGYCVLPPEKVKKVFLAPDLVRDDEGNPIKNEKTGAYDIQFREVSENELENDKKTYKAKKDYLQFVEQEKKRLGYIDDKILFSDSINSITSVIHTSNIEGNMTKNNVIATLKNFLNSIKNKIKQWETPKLDLPTDEKISNITGKFNHDEKNPYRDKNFSLTIANFQKMGLEQLDLKQELEKITTGEIGKYFRSKERQINKDIIVDSKTHGINHNNRVALHSMIIAQNEGILENDTNNRTKDILLSAAYYHDIGRKAGALVLDVGPHSKRSAKKIKNLDIEYLDGQTYSTRDKNILMAVIEAHNRKDEMFDKVCKKYNIQEQDIEYTKTIMSIIKDADALDRVRLDLNRAGKMKVNLNANYLRTNTSKQLLDASYQLEQLTNKVSFDRILAYKTNEQTIQPKGKLESKRDEFVNYLKQGIANTPKYIQKTKTKLKLAKDKLHLKGNNMLIKFKNMKERRSYINNYQKNNFEPER